MNKILTIVIPTYNMEEYLRSTLDSLIVPEYERKNLEVLIINDGSKDNSSAIGHEYQENYPDVFRVIDKENGNYGSCVNRGLAEAKGKYTKILDADDSFDNDNFVLFLKKLEACDADVVITDYTLVTPEKKVIEHRTFSFKPEREYQIDEICTEHEFKEICMHALTYKTNNIRKLNYHQTEGISYTDQEWIYLPMVNMLTVKYIKLDIYQYMIGREGQTMDPSVIARSLGHYFKLVGNRVEEMSKRKLNLSSAMEEYLYYKAMLMATFIYRAVLIRRIGDLNELLVLDEKIKATDDILYSKLEQEKMMGTSFYYIKYFHKHHSRIPRIYSLIYNFLYTYIKVKYTQRKSWSRGGVIEDKQTMKEWIRADFESYRMVHPVAARFTYGENWDLFSYMRNLRHLEYYTNKQRKMPWDKLLRGYYWLRHRRNTKLLNITISPNSVGPGFHIQHRGYRLFLGDTKIGMNCEVLPMVLIGKKSPEIKECPISIGDDCYISTGVTILGPITIGNNVTIAAGAVVTKDIPDNCIVAGIPAKIIKYK